MEIHGAISEILKDKGMQVWSVSPGATVFDAIQLMADKNVGALVVLEVDRLAGVFSERDYTRKVILQGKSSKQTAVGEILTPNVITASPSDSVTHCLRKMTECRVRHLPVVEDGKVVGIVSIGDLVKWVISAQTATIDHLEGYITGRYPA